MFTLRDRAFIFGMCVPYWKRFVALFMNMVRGLGGGIDITTVEGCAHSNYR